MALQQNRLITVTLDGGAIGVFDTREGGEANGVVVKRRSGGMGPIKQSAGLPDYSDVTVSREAADNDEIRSYMTRAGKAEMVVNDYTLDENGQRFGKPITYLGKLMTVAPAPANSDSAETAMLTLTMSVRSVA